MSVEILERDVPCRYLVRCTVCGDRYWTIGWKSDIEGREGCCSCSAKLKRLRRGKHGGES